MSIIILWARVVSSKWSNEGYLKRYFVLFLQKKKEWKIEDENRGVVVSDLDLSQWILQISAIDS